MPQFTEHSETIGKVVGPRARLSGCADLGHFDSPRYLRPPSGSGPNGGLTRGLPSGSLNSPALDTLATVCDPSGINLRSMEQIWRLA